MKNRIFLAVAAFGLLAFGFPFTAHSFLLGAGGLASNPSSSGAFSPASLPGLQVWLDPNDPSFRTSTTLLDKSGNGNDFAGGAFGTSLVSGPNGTTVLNITSSGYLISSGYNGPSMTAFEVWYVALRTDDSGNANFARFLTFNSKFSLGFHTDPTYGPLQIVDRNNDEFKGSVTLDLTTYHLYRVTYNAGTWTVYQDGVSKTVTDAGNYAQLDGASTRIGSGEYGSVWNGRNGDIVIVSGAVLSDSNATNTTKYLSDKYGLGIP